MRRVFLLLVLFLFFPSTSFAVSTTILNFPSTITADEFTVIASISGSTSDKNYLRIDLYKDGTDKYFGETFNGQNWYSDSNGTQYFPVTIDDNKNGLATISGRVGNPTVTEFSGSGAYKLKIRRYTSEKGYSYDDQTPVDVHITLPTPTPTPVPTNTPIPTSKPTNISTLAPTTKPTATSTPIPTNKPASNAANATPTKILPTSTKSPTSSGISAANNPTSQKKTEVLGTSTNKSPFAFIFIIIGSLFFLVCGILGFLKYEEDKKKKNSE